MTELTKHKLTERQERFAQEYVKCGNGAEAARRAGYNESCAKETASEILTYPHVQARIAELKQEQASDPENVLTVEKVMRDLRRIAESGDSESVRVRAYELIAKHLQAFLPGRRIQIELPQIVTADDCALAQGKIAEAMARGEITIEDAKGAGDVIENQRKAIETADLERRINEFEAWTVAQRSSRPAELMDADRQ